MKGWDRFWYRPTPLLRLACFRIAVAWLCLYDAFLYDPTHLLAEAGNYEPAWNPLVVFELCGVTAPSATTSAVLAVVHAAAALLVLGGLRTRTACLLLALLVFWQGGVFYSLTKVRHDRVALCFATFALACSPCGARLSIDSWLRRGRSTPDPSPEAGWPLLLTQATITIGYAAAGLTKLLQGGWSNGYTLQGIVLGHRGPFAELAAASPTACQVMSVLTIGAELLCPLCLLVPRLAFVFVPLLLGFHWATWATMDTGPYMTLWYLLVAFVPLDLVRGWWQALRMRHPMSAAGVAVAACVVVAVAVVVMWRVVPLPWLLAAAAVHGALLWRRDGSAAAPGAVSA